MTSIKVSEITKQYGLTVALNSLDLDISAGTVHGVIGENGAGKSTLVKILSGLTRPNRGSLSIGGREVAFDAPKDAREAGVAVAFQELSLIPDLSVADNLSMPNKPRRFGWLTSDSRSRADAREALAEWGLEGIDPLTPVRALSLAARQQVEIVGAIARDPELLILDEPTSALGQAEADWLFEQVHRLRERGSTVIFVSHRMSEVRELCDEASVLRNGRRVGVISSLTETSDDQIIEMMIGETLDRIFPDKLPAAAVTSDSKPVLSARGLASGGLRSASFDLGQSEVLGIAGLQDQGQRDLFRALFGAERVAAGVIEVDGEPVKFKTPRDAIRSGMGISLVPEDRAAEGALLEMTGRANITLPSVRRFTRLGWIDSKAETAAVTEVLDRLQISHRALYEPVEAFSGGNQQKMIMGKWILSGSKTMLLYDPTRGVDIKTKSEIYRMIRDLAAEGKSVLFHSTDIEELVNVCDRVMVCYRGRLQAPIVGDEISSGRILREMLGAADEPLPAKGTAR